MPEKFDVTLLPDNSPDEFRKACAKMETAFPGIKKDKLLIDVDGSLIQVYTHDDEGNETIIYDDYEVGAVYVKSDIDLSDLFTDWKALR